MKLKLDDIVLNRTFIAKDDFKVDGRVQYLIKPEIRELSLLSMVNNRLDPVQWQTGNFPRMFLPINQKIVVVFKEKIESSNVIGFHFEGSTDIFFCYAMVFTCCFEALVEKRKNNI